MDVSNDSKPYDDKLIPKDQLNNAIEQAKKENKYVLLQFGGNWCGWCILMHKYFNSTEEVKKVLNSNFVYVHINNETDKSFCETYAPSLQAYPHLSVVSSEGKLIAEQPTDQLEEGNGYNEQRVLQFLNGGIIENDHSCKKSWK